MYVQFNLKLYFEKNTIIRSIKKRSIDLQLWIMVSGGWVLSPFPNNKHQVVVTFLDTIEAT